MNAQVQDSSFHTVSEYPAKSKNQQKISKTHILNSQNSNIRVSQSVSFSRFFLLFVWTKSDGATDPDTVTDTFRLRLKECHKQEKLCVSHRRVNSGPTDGRTERISKNRKYSSLQFAGDPDAVAASMPLVLVAAATFAASFQYIDGRTSTTLCKN